MKVELVLGPNAVEALLDEDPSRLIELFVEAGSRNPRVLTLAARAQAEGLSVQSRPRPVLDQLAGGQRHQGLIARARSAQRRDEHDLETLIAEAGAKTLLLVLDGVTDPHNLGACLRSAEAAGAQAVIAPRDRAVGLTPVARRAAAGAAERIAFVQVTNLARCLRRLRAAGVWIVGATGEETALPIWQLDLRGPLALVLGSEGEGMRRLTREHCDYLARIPMAGRAESLNVSVAAGILLFEALRQRSA